MKVAEGDPAGMRTVTELKLSAMIAAPVELVVEPFLSGAGDMGDHHVADTRCWCMAPPRVTVNVPVSGPSSAAFGSVATMVTAGSSAIVTVAVEPSAVAMTVSAVSVTALKIGVTVTVVERRLECAPSPR